MLFLPGCSNKTDTLPDQSSAKVSQCNAIKIARTQVPQRIAEETPASGLRTDLGTHGTWFVTFVNVNITFNELGWKGDAGDYYKKQDLEQALPKGVYANVTIYVDAETGEVTKREINNGFFIGGPIQNLVCE